MKTFFSNQIFSFEKLFLVGSRPVKRFAIALVMASAAWCALAMQPASAQMLGTDNGSTSSSSGSSQGGQGGYHLSTGDQRPCDPRRDTDCTKDSSSYQGPETVYVVPGGRYRQRPVTPTVPLQPTPSWAEQQQINRDRANADWQRKVNTPPGT